MSLVSDQSLITDVDRDDVQKYCVVAFLSPEDRLKSSIIKEINSIFNTKINNKINYIVNNMKNDLINTYNNKLITKINNINSIVYENNDENIRKNNIVDICNNLFINSPDIDKSPNTSNTSNIFNYTSREFNYSDDDLKYIFHSYVADNDKELQESYKSLHGEETNTRGFKVRAVLKDPSKCSSIISSFNEKVTTKFCVPIGKWIPWQSTTINNIGYTITDDMLYSLEKTMNTYLDSIKEDNIKFQKRLESSKLSNTRDIPSFDF